MKGIIFILVGLAVLFSCGFYNSQQGSVFESNSREGDAGDGDVPKLAARSNSRPGIDNEDCKGIKNCEKVCDVIYKELGSQRDCYKLRYGKVSHIQEVYDALLDAGDDELDDIETTYLEDYLEIGTDGWLEVVIPKLKKDYTKFHNTLEWIGGSKDVAQALEDQDRNNDILRTLFLKYCVPNSSNGDCQNKGTGKTIVDGQPSGNGSVVRFDFDYTSGKLLCKAKTSAELVFTGADADATQITTITDTNKKNLLLALSNSKDWGTGKNFFSFTKSNEDAFILAHELLKQACPESNNNEDVRKCIRGFYCWVKAYAGSLSIPKEIESDVFKTNDNSLVCTCDDINF